VVVVILEDVDAGLGIAAASGNATTSATSLDASFNYTTHTHTQGRMVPSKPSLLGENSMTSKEVTQKTLISILSSESRTVTLVFA
jgi:hypothetical protein